MKRGRCVPCGTTGLRGGNAGFGAIVMQPLKGSMGLGDAGDVAMRAGAAGPVMLMAGSALVYGAVSGIAARSWGVAGTGALLGAGLTGVLTGGTAVATGASAQDGETRSTFLTIGAPGALIGAGLLAWGGYRAYKRRR